MKEVQLTQGYIAFVDDEDFEKVSQRKWRVLKSGLTAYGYSNKDELLHRFILGITDTSIKVDHKDRCGLNCCKHNLRAATHSQNLANQAKTHGSSKYKGVSWHKASNKWRASIKKDGQPIHLGLFHTEEMAKAAHDKAALEVFGEFARF